MKMCSWKLIEPKVNWISITISNQNKIAICIQRTLNTERKARRPNCALQASSKLLNFIEFLKIILIFLLKTWLSHLSIPFITWNDFKNAPRIGSRWKKIIRSFEEIPRNVWRGFIYLSWVYFLEAFCRHRDGISRGGQQLRGDDPLWQRQRHGTIMRYEPLFVEARQAWISCNKLPILTTYKGSEPTTRLFWWHSISRPSGEVWP